MAVLGRWTGGTTTLVPTTSWVAPNALFPTQQRNDASAYSWASSTSTLTLPSSNLADGYLIIASFTYVDTSDGRFTPRGKIIQASGTGNFVGGPTGGFSRDSSEDTAYVRCWAFVDNPSASATFQFQYARDTDAPTGGTTESSFEIIPLYYSDISIYSSTEATLFGGTTRNNLTSWSTVVEGTNITIDQGNQKVTVTGDNKRYLVLGSQYTEGRAGRTQRWFGFNIDAVPKEEAKAYAYFRTSSTDATGGFYTTIVKTATADVDIEQTCYRGDGVASGEGGADVDGSTPSLGQHSWVILELNDSAEVFSPKDSTGGVDLNVTGPVDLTINATLDDNDAASFVSSSSTQVKAVVAMDMLFGANIAAAQTVVSTTTRWTCQANLTVGGTEDADTIHGNYARNNQGSQDTFGWSANLLSFRALSVDDLLGVSVQEISGGEDGGQYEVQANWAGMWGVNLDTLVPSVNLSPTGIASAEAVGSATLSVGNVNVVPGGVAGAEAIGVSVLLAGNVNVVPGGIASAEGIGAQVIAAGNINVAPGGITSSEAIGVSTLVTGPVSVSVTGIASVEAIGSPQINLSVLVAGGIASAEAVGSAQLNLSVLVAGGIASAGAIGSHSLAVGNTNVVAGGIASAETFGSTSLLAGNVNVVPGGISTGQALGSVTLVAGNVNAVPGGIASSEALGSATLSVAGVSVVPGGIASAEAIGSQVVVAGNVSVSVSGIASSEALGDHTLKATSDIIVTGIASAEAIGSAQIDMSILLAGGIASAGATGPPTLLVGNVNVTPAGISSGEVFGTPILSMNIQLGAGIASAESVPGPSVVINLHPAGIATAEAVPSPSVLAGNANVIPGGVSSSEVIGSPEVVNAVALNPGGIASAEAIGSHTIKATSEILAAGGIASAEAIGSHSVTILGFVVEPAGIPTAEAIGGPTVTAPAWVMQTVGIPSAEAVGNHALDYPWNTTASGIASGEVVPNAANVLLNDNTVLMYGFGIPSSEAVGEPTLVGGYDYDSSIFSRILRPPIRKCFNNPIGKLQ